MCCYTNNNDNLINTGYGCCNFICKGGSESFQDKRSFFYKEVCKVHASHTSRAFKKLRISNINRKNVLKSVRK